ncbi:AAA family ATPase [Clostridium botulinum]|uniref:Nuclease SbcCD subunit C n=5 Tax=Clostridium botulinum TaxID=1491 RepID=A0A9Q1ZD71_CLOBO|nr:AAA family ATPase [Clostridium botulinum]KLU75003.1 exonuclease [Clostridium botulinum V891]KOA74376.1 exonuclease [Clostridium botulinum]KOA77791.1 exonuclease [Clostridium botulinum]KOA87945.1 exonuclease [Clostridium botulinum]KOA89075.1 exonuclease [Clostridium botulinum]
MKPRLLKISGLNSFENQQIIEFDKLTEKGLFGIFGPTGSGKSTILDAITIALYGKITRTNKGFINTTTKNLNVSYEFEIGVGKERKIYLAERNIKVNKNDRYNTKHARLLEKSAEGERIIAEGPTELQNEIQKIIGLTVDDFTRSVVLPQGKFSDFLKLGGREKRNMLERIFALEKYGQVLSEKIKKVRNINLKEENILMGELKKYEDLTEEGFKEKESRLKELQKEQDELKIKKRDVDKSYEKYKEIWNLQLEFKEFKNKELKLNEKLDYVNLKKEQFKKGQSALKVKPFIDEVTKTFISLNKNSEQLKDLQTDLKKIEEELLITEKNYNYSLKEKDEMIPKLIKEESDFSRAIEVNKKILIIESETEKLRENYKNIRDKKNEILSKIKLLVDNREKIVKEINDIENRINDIKVDPEYREKLQWSLEKENDYKKSLEKQLELQKKISEKQEKIQEMCKDYDEILKVKNEYDCIVKKLEVEDKKLIENNPGDNSLLLDKSQKLNDTTKKLQELLKDNVRKIEIEELLKEILNKKIPLEEEINLLKDKLLKNKDLLHDVENKIEYIRENNLASILSEKLVEGEPCPVCGSIHHTNIVIPVDKNTINKVQKEKLDLQNIIQNLNDKITQLSIQVVSLDKEEEHIKGDYVSLTEKLKDIDLEKLSEKKKKCELEFLELKEKIEKYSELKNKLEINIKNKKEEKNLVDIKETRVAENIKNEKLILKELNSELLKESEELNKLSQEYMILKKELKVENIQIKMKEIISFEKEAENIKCKEKELRKHIENIDIQKEKLSQEEKELDIKLGKVKQSGTEKSKSIKEYKYEVEKLCNGKEPQENLIIVTNKIKEILETNDKLKVKLEEEKKRKDIIYNEKLSLEKAEKIYNERLKEEEHKLNISLKESGFNDTSEVKKYLLDEEILLSIEKEINVFDDEIKNIRNNLERIEEKLNGDKIESDKWEELNKRKEEIENIIANNLKEVATLQKVIEDLKKDLDNLKILRTKEKELEHKLSLLSDLTKLVEGNKFVEFVAMNQLRYIAREASRRLKEITRDRYALEIDLDGNFTIRDDFNGGELRDASTLSGGETFLTSLSLALSLSSQVQLKGSAPLEFFFLDEGFGTLDTDLLDVVMSSLERLHSSRLSVGIISHVEELKNRVPIKLVVNSASPGEGGSKVKLEYT